MIIIQLGLTLSDERATNPSSGVESAEQIIANMQNLSSSESGEGSSKYEDPEDTEEIKAAKRAESEPQEVEWTEKEVILYNLGIGAKVDELQWVYENNDNFSVRYHHTQDFVTD